MALIQGNTILEFEVYCRICGNNIDHLTTVRKINGRDALTISPCDKCVERESEIEFKILKKCKKGDKVLTF